MITPCLLRPLAPADSIAELTALIRRAYQALAQAGLNYTGTYQTEENTRRCIARGECWVAEWAGRLVGTVCLRPPGAPTVCEYYQRPGVAVLNRLAVEPAMQRQGIGAGLIRRMEARGRELGAAELALDTAEPATHLVTWYQKLGFRPAARVQWKDKTYASVILSKPLA